MESRRDAGAPGEDAAIWTYVFVTGAEFLALGEIGVIPEG
jgi:hypothetical protein